MSESFSGNIKFASYDSMNFYRTGRKDDMISMFYMLSLVMNNDREVCRENDFQDLDEKCKDLGELFKAYRKYK